MSDLSVRFGDATVLDRISLDIARGERVVLVGPSGAGKTTLLRAIAGLTSVASGRIDIGGSDRTTVPPERRDAVYLHQTPVLFPHMDVFGNISFPLRVRGVREVEIRDRVNRALAAVHLEDFGARSPATLSGGQRHRVALARAIVAEPAVLLLDEPLSSLDPALRDEVRDAIIRAQTESGAGLLLVTHDLDEAGLIGHRIGVLLDRTVAQITSPAELFARPASLPIARLVGIGNEIIGTVDDSGVFVFSAGSVPLGPDEQTRGPAMMVFRPDAVSVLDGAPICGIVTQLRHRAERTTALVDASGVSFEVMVDSLAPPAPGDRIGLAFDSRRVVVFPRSS